MRPILSVRLATMTVLSLAVSGCSWASGPSPEERVAKTEAALAAACAHPEREEPRRALTSTCEEHAIACEGSASVACARIAGLCNRGLRTCADAPKP